tara:strand:+ start:262 stop:1332 length:1071 start_codon:yes stop_codon:yes gene_type:complete
MLKYNPLDPLNPFGTKGLFDDINKTNQQINSMNIPTQPTQQEQDFKRQRYGNMMLALSDVLRGKDPSAGVMQRQALIDAEQQEAERKRKVAEYKKDNPGMVDMLEALEAGIPPTLLNNKDSSPSSVKEYKFAKQEGYTGSYEDFLQSKKATTNINTGISGFQKSAVDAYNNVQAAAKDARVINTSLDTLDNLLNKGVDTGFGAGFGLSLQRIGQTIIGEDYEVPEIAGREAFQAETTKLILPLVKQLGVNPTDKDLEFVKTGAIELSKSEAGNRIMIAGLRLSQQRKLDEANFDNQFYINYPNATVFERNIAFQKHMNSNPQLYTSTSLQTAYDNLLLDQAANSSAITTNEESPFE